MFYKKTMKNTLLVNFYGEPGAGKSTGAAYVFSKLKLAEVNCELVTEVAKDLVWEDRSLALGCQAYVFGSQVLRLERLRGKVDVVLTDSPIALGAFYLKPKDEETLGNSFKNVIFNYAERAFPNHLDFFIKRVKPFFSGGRIHGEHESLEISKRVKSMLDERFPNYEEADGDMSGYDMITDKILAKIKQADFMQHIS